MQEKHDWVVLGISHEVTVRRQLGLQLSEGLTVAGGSSSKVTRSHG